MFCFVLFVCFTGIKYWIAVDLQWIAVDSYPSLVYVPHILTKAYYLTPTTQKR